MTKEYCDFFWGSHGCDLPPGHKEQMHQCQVYNEREDSLDLCSQFDPYALVYTVRFYHYDIDDWGAWMNWGSGFSNHDPDPLQMNC